MLLLKILRVFLEVEGLIQIGELFDKVSIVDELIALSTVQSTMLFLVESGLARENIFFGNRSYFENISTEKHHGYFVCTRCKNVKPFYFCQSLIEGLQEGVANRNSFSISSQRMILGRICQDCQ